MHQPLPYGQFDGGEALSPEDVAAVNRHMKQIANFQAISDVDSVRMVRALPSGASLVVLDMGGIRKAIVSPPPKAGATVEHEGPGTVHVRVPMLFSGVVKTPVVEPSSAPRLALTATCQRRLNAYGEGAAASQVSLHRFAIEYGPLHQEFKPPNARKLYTQYGQLLPGWFSGRMAALVQIAGGYGRHDFERLPQSRLERVTMELPDEVTKAIAQQLKMADSSRGGPGPLLPGCQGWPVPSGEIQFDYKFKQTHGVSFGADGWPWLVRVSPAGVYAMPLPLVPATTTPAFREYVESASDTELQWILDVFKGMPSGEGFPSEPQAFEAWRRAGVIIKVCDAGGFYQNSGYSSAMGWSFSAGGGSAVNTCWGWGDDGLQRGRTFMLSVRLGALKDGGRLDFNEIEMPADPIQASRLRGYLHRMSQRLGNSSKGRAIRYKLCRADVRELLARASNAQPDMAEEVDYWDAMEAQPIAACSGGIRKTAEGIVWAPGNPKSHPQIKFPEPVSNPKGCLSHDFGRLEGYPPPKKAPRCDTIMHAYFIGDDLKVCKYFRDDRTWKQEEENNFDECMQVGSWRQVITQGSTSLMGHFHTSDFDERKAAAETTTVTEIVGKDLGYDSVPNFAFDHFFSMTGTMWRNRYFQHDIHTEVSDGYGLAAALCVPFLARHSVLHAFKEWTSGGRVTDSRAVYYTRDPNTYRYFTYHSIWAWVGGDASGNMAHAPKVTPYPKDGNPVWVTGYNYHPSRCSGFADQGDWVGGLPADYTWLIHPDSNTWQHSGGGGRPTVKNFVRTRQRELEEKGALHISLDPAPQAIHKKVPRKGYFEKSPTEHGDVFYVDAARCHAGRTRYSSCSEQDPDSPGARKCWGFSRHANPKQIPRFIGVIHE